MNNNQLIELKNELKQAVYKGKLYCWSEIYELAQLRQYDRDTITLFHRWFNLVMEFGYLNEIPINAEEIFFHNAYTCEIKIKDQKIEYLHDLTQDDFELSLEILTLKNDIDWNYTKPFCSFYMCHKDTDFRISLVHKSLTSNSKPKGFFRILNKTPLSVESYSNYQILKELVFKKKNFIIAGATGSGKTTLTNSLIQLTTDNDHLLIIEDTKELISPSQKVTRLISDKSQNTSLNDLLTYGLRMSPDRLILGEVRSNEVVTLIQAMNTGHKGVISTIHANSAHDAISRMAMLFTLYSKSQISFNDILKLITRSIDCVVYMENKEIKEIINVLGSEKEQVYFDLVNHT